MTTINIHMDEKSYLQGIALSEAIFEYVSDEDIEIYNNIANETPEIPCGSDDIAVSEIINKGLMGLQAIQNRQNRIKDIINIFQQNLLNLIEDSELTAWGYKIPRNIEDKPIKIPADLIINGEINWDKSELNSQGIEITGIRVFENIELNINSEDNINSDKLIINKKEIKAEVVEDKKQSFADLDPELHIDENKASKLLGISPRTLQGYRSKGGGPEFRKIGARTVRYKIKDLINWTQKRNNTSEV